MKSEVAVVSKASRAFREKNLSYNGGALRFLAIALTIMYAWILIWALVLKLCDHNELLSNYYTLRNLTIEERLLLDIIPFRYHGDGMIVTVLNCLVLIPMGVTLSYSFKKRRIMLGAAISFLFIIFIETTQMFTTFGNLATEDFITNIFGYFVGVAIYQIFFKRIPERAAVIMLSASCVLCVALTAYTVMTAINSSELIFSLINRTY